METYKYEVKSITLNAHHVNSMTHFNLKIGTNTCTPVRILDTLHVTKQNVH